MQYLNATTATEEQHEDSCEDTEEDNNFCQEEDLYSDEERDVVLHEIGLTDDEENDNIENDETVNVTRSGKRVQPRKFFWDYSLV